MKDLPVYKRNTWIFYITQFLHSLVFTIPIWIVYYQGKITVAEISYLVTIQYLSQMFLELPSGALADLIGRKNTNLVGWIIGAASFFLFPLATNFYHFLILALMVGLNDSFRSGSEEALLYDTYKQADKENEYDKVYGNGDLIYQVGLILATATGGLLFEQWVFLPYLLYGLSLFLGSICILFYKEPHIDSETFTLKNYVLQIKNGSKEAFKSQYTRYLSLFYIAVAGIAWSSTLYFNEFMMVEFIASDSLRGILTAGMRLINVLLIRLILQDTRIFSERSRILFFPVIMLIGYLPGIKLDGFWGIPFIQAAMIATTARWILLSPLTNKAFSSKYRATAISFLSLAIGFVYVVMTTISAPVISQFGIRTMYSLLGVFTVLSVVPLTYKLLTTDKDS
ncbi:MAG: MFS transporter [Pseudomonadales bacterium]|nr:MFS transporter [Pseudomonadales bacterium]